jgi:Tol biopolymer transport system component
MTRRDAMRAGIKSATTTIALLAPWRLARAAGSNQKIAQGTIYIYAWEEGNGRAQIARGIFALERMTWTKVADQSKSKSYDTYFRVSRDGRYLAFARRDRTGPPDEVVAVTIRDLARDGAIRELSTVGFNPFWSADGQTLMMSAAKTDIAGKSASTLETWIVNADGSDPRRLPIPETEQVDDWSPDGAWIVTDSRRDPGIGYQIYRMRLDGTESIRLTKTGAGVINIDGRISADGRQIAYLRMGDRQSGIWVMDADGASARRIFAASPEAIPGAPSWSPDGRMIACSIHSERKHEKGYLEMVDHKVILLNLNGDAPVKVNPPLTSGLGNPQWAASWTS